MIVESRIMGYDLKIYVIGKEKTMDELEKALITIREECKKNDLCVSCRLYTSDGKCGLNKFGNPSRWELRSDNNIPKRVFK